MTTYHLHQHGSNEDRWVGFGPQDTSEWPTAFAWLVLGNVHLIVAERIKWPVLGLPHSHGAQRRA